MIRGQQCEDLDALLKDRTYLGDGAFVARDRSSGTLVIYAENGIRVTNAVVIEDEAKLIRFIQQGAHA